MNQTFWGKSCYVTEREADAEAGDAFRVRLPEDELYTLVK